MGLVQGCAQTEHAEHQPARSGETIAARRLLGVDPHTTRRVSPLDSLSSAATVNSTPSWPVCGHGQRPGLPSDHRARCCGRREVLTVGEFITGLDDQATVVRGHCLPYGEGITYWPLAEVVTDIASLMARRNRPYR